MTETELEKVPPVLSELSEQLTSQALKAAIYDQIVRLDLVKFEAKKIQDKIQAEAKKIQDEIARLNKQLQELNVANNKCETVS